MQLVLYAAVGLAAALAIDAYLPPDHPAAAPPAAQDAALAAHLSGTWTGHRTGLLRTRREDFTMTWCTAPDGHLTGTVAVPGQPKYPVNVVWSSDTAFIYESAPHLSHALHENVVVRSVVHFKGGSLDGTFEARPTKYTGKTLTGRFTAARST